jgi:hypothetical protein
MEQITLLGFTKRANLPGQAMGSGEKEILEAPESVTKAAGCNFTLQPR